MPEKPKDQKKTAASPDPIESSDANAAARAEATGSGVEVTYEGETYTVGSGDEWPREAGLAFSELADSRDNPARAFKYVNQFVSAVLGPAQYDRFTRGAGATTSGVNGMYRELFKAYGFTSGE